MRNEITDFQAHRSLKISKRVSLFWHNHPTRVWLRTYLWISTYLLFFLEHSVFLSMFSFAMWDCSKNCIQRLSRCSLYFLFFLFFIYQNHNIKIVTRFNDIIAGFFWCREWMILKWFHLNFIPRSSATVP